MELTKIANELKIQNENLSKKSKSLKNDNKKLYDQNKKLIQGIPEKVFLENDFHFFENLLVNILNILPIQDIKSAANNIIDLYDFANNIEKDKLKLEKKMENLEKEYNIIIKEKFRNVELENSLINQINNMKKLIFDYQNKINDKKYEIQNIENKIFGNKISFLVSSNSNFNNTNKGNSFSNNISDINNLQRISNNFDTISNNPNTTLNYSNSLIITNDSHVKNKKNFESNFITTKYINENNEYKEFKNTDNFASFSNFAKESYIPNSISNDPRANNHLNNNLNFSNEAQKYNFNYNLNPEINEYQQEQLNNYDNTQSTTNYIDYNSSNLNFNSTDFRENLPKEDTCENLRSDFLNSNNILNNINSFFKSGSVKNSESLKNINSKLYNNYDFISINETYNLSGMPNKNNFDEHNQNESKKENSTFTFSQNESQISNNSHKRNFLINNLNNNNNTNLLKINSKGDTNLNLNLNQCTSNNMRYSKNDNENIQKVNFNRK